MKNILDIIKNYFRKNVADNSFAVIQPPLWEKIYDIVSFIKEDSAFNCHCADVLKTDYIPALREVYPPLTMVLENMHDKLTIEQAKQYQSYISEDDNSPDGNVWTILRALEDKSKGIHEIKWTMLGYNNNPTEVEFEAYSMDSATWDILQLYNEEVCGNSEGYFFQFLLDPTINEVPVPNCDCAEVSSTDTINGNCLDSNCDTWGTSYGVKACRLYAIYITDLDKYAVVWVNYWCL